MLAFTEHGAIIAANVLNSSRRRDERARRWRFRASAGDDRLAQGAGEAPGRARGSLRPAVQGRVRRDPRASDPARAEAQAEDRVRTR
jgi:hypothetical protein